MAHGPNIATKETIRRLTDGTLPWEDVKRLLKMEEKDPDRFKKYLEVLQERVPWSERILLRISEHLYIVRAKEGGRIVKCDCGHVYGDYRINWKLGTEIFVRQTEIQLSEIYTLGIAPDSELVEVREFYCPGCYAQLAVEVVPAGYPLILEFLPDLDTFYRDWLGQPLEDASEDWYQDLSDQATRAWSEERQRVDA